MSQQRNEKGHFIKGNTVSKCTHKYSPRTTQSNFKSLASQILDGLSVQDAIDKIKNFDDVNYVYTLIKLIDHTENYELKKMQTELAKLKFEKENGTEDETDRVINITFTEIEEEEEEEDETSKK